MPPLSASLMVLVAFEFFDHLFLLYCEVFDTRFSGLFLSQGAFTKYNERLKDLMCWGRWGSGGTAEGFVGGSLL